MADQLELCNRALRLIKQLPITSLSTTTDASAVVVNAMWEGALEEFLSEAFWNWAKTRDTLTETSPAPSFGWSHRFALPDDLVSVVGVNETYANTPSDVFEIEGGYIMSDDNVASDPAQMNLEYIYKPTTTTLDAFCEAMDPKAANAFVVLLASKIAPQLTQDGHRAAAEILERYYRVDLPKARARNGNQNRPPPRFPSHTSTNRTQRFGYTNS